MLGPRPILIVVVRDPQGKFKDTYLFTTDLSQGSIVGNQAVRWRWSIEVLFKSSKQVLEFESPQHWCQESVEKLAPWVWLLQSVLSVWYLTVGRTLPEAESARRGSGQRGTRSGPLSHWVRVFRDGHDERQH